MDLYFNMHMWHGGQAYSEVVKERSLNKAEKELDLVLTSFKCSNSASRETRALQV